MFPKADTVAVLHKVVIFKIAQKVFSVLGYFCKQICCQELSKIAQSGHTEQDLYIWTSSFKIVRGYRQLF